MTQEGLYMFCFPKFGIYITQKASTEKNEKTKNKTASFYPEKPMWPERKED